MARKRVAPGRTPADEHCLRRIFLLKLILGGKDEDIKSIIKELKEYKCKSPNLDHIKKDTELLSKAGWDFRLGSKILEDGQVVQAILSRGATFAFLWKDSETAGRLDQQVIKKGLLAKAIVNDMQAMENVKWAILGSGTSVHAVARELFERSKTIGIEGISTSNIFVLQEFIRQKPKIKIEITAGTLDWGTACLLRSHGSPYQEGSAAQIVVTSFSGLTKEGFHTIPVIDVVEKEQQLDPKSTSCRYILIPLEWDKIGRYHQLVKLPTDLTDRIHTLSTLTSRTTRSKRRLRLLSTGRRN